MKRLMLVLMVVVLVGVAGSVFAAGSATINVSATVAGICKFSTASANLSFGTLTPDPTAVDAPGSGTISFWCTKGVGAPTFAITGYTLGAVRQMSGTGANIDKLDYSIDSLSPDASSNTGPSAPRTLTISGTAYVAGASGYNSITADAYGDSVVLTVTP